MIRSDWKFLAVLGAGFSSRVIDDWNYGNKGIVGWRKLGEQFDSFERIRFFSSTYYATGGDYLIEARMKEQRIAVLTYHKYPAEPWPEKEFRTQSVSLINGEVVELHLAERGVRLSNDRWARRRLGGGVPSLPSSSVAARKATHE